VKPYGWIGVAVLLGAEALLYAGNGFVATWFTPIQWTGTILLVDAIVAARTGASWLTTRRREFPFLALLSVLSWLVFEGYNLSLRNWQYVGVPDSPWVRSLGFFWSFATITPALFETAELLGSLPRGRSVPPPDARRTRPGPRGMAAVALGLALLAIPPLLPAEVAPYTFALVWVGLIPLLEPLNWHLGQPSLAREWARGNRTPVWAWLGAGLVCGLLWEAWNYQTLSVGGAGWLYTMPQPIHDLVFGLHYGKMPVAGLLGFPPFAWESFALYTFLRWLLRLDRLPGIGTLRSWPASPPARDA